MKIKGEPLGNVLALAGGALLYVGATHLLPAVEKEKKKYSLLTLVAGVTIAFAVVLLRK